MDNRALAGWYQPRRAHYPWRSAPADPYAVLVSEVMLQQTQAARVAPAFRAFLERFPDVRSLAAASRADVLRAWAGLGYNRRAVALHEAARSIVGELGGEIPVDPVQLRTLRGVGPYTAAAVASLAFGVPVPAIDTNVARVVARFELGADVHDAPPASVRAAAVRALDRGEPGAWNQAVMDLGRDVCRPRPRCEACPLRGRCRYRRAGRAGSLRRARRVGEPFAGSSRAVRGAVVRVLRRTSPSTLSGIASRTGFPLARVAEAVRALRGDGLVAGGPAAWAGRPGGRVRLGN